MAQKDEAKAPAKKGAGVMKVLFLLLAAILLVGGAVGATLYYTGALHKTAEVAEEQEEPPAPKAAATDAHGAKPAKAQRKVKGGRGETAARVPIYQALDPPFIINFEDQGVLRYLQIGLSVMAREQQIIDAVNNNMPQIRNNLILLFGNQKLENLNATEGREQLRTQALEQVQAVLNEEIGEPGIEAVYYTAFVMQ